MTVIYLDHAATAYPRHPSVGEAMLAALSIAGNVGRGGHQGAATGTSIVAECRERLASVLGARDAERMLIFPSATAALNTVIEHFAPRDGSVNDDRRIAIGPLEHNAVTRPLKRRFGDARTAVLPAHPDGRIDLEALESFDVAGMVAVIVQHASNVSGIVQPVEEIGTWCAEHRIPFVVDGAQAAGLVPFRIEEIPALIAYTSAGHKFLGGPPGIGVAYFAPNFQPEPLWVGGNGVRSEAPTVPDDGPARFECGTSNLPGIAGLRAALGELDASKMESEWDAAQQLRRRWVDRLREIDGIDVIGEGDPVDRTPVISVRVRGMSPAAASAALESAAGIRTRAGLHCAPAAHRFYGTLDGGTLRLAPGIDLDDETTERVFAQLERLVR
ncbi:MAG: aminotransferase class V-fold PLP-dependent enzyme [Planctomycetota bacterium]